MQFFNKIWCTCMPSSRSRLVLWWWWCGGSIGPGCSSVLPMLQDSSFPPIPEGSWAQQGFSLWSQAPWEWVHSTNKKPAGAAGWVANLGAHTESLFVHLGFFCAEKQILEHIHNTCSKIANSETRSVFFMDCWGRIACDLSSVQEDHKASKKKISTLLNVAMLGCLDIVSITGVLVVNVNCFYCSPDTIQYALLEVILLMFCHSFYYFSEWVPNRLLVENVWEWQFTS